MVRPRIATASSVYVRLLLIVLAALAVLVSATHVYGADLFQRSLELSDDRASQVGTYQLGFTITAPEVLGSIKLQICANSPLIGDVCNLPAGFDISGATLTTQTGQTGFIILPSGTNTNTITLSRVPALAGAGAVSYTLSGVVNPSAEGAYYGRIETFTSADASGADTDHGGLAFSINSEVEITATIPPYLLFCSGVTITGFDCATASGSYVNLGTLTDQATVSGTSQLLTATNAANGFTISVAGTTLTSGNNVIPAITPPDVSRPGTSQFGLNLVANATPSVGQDPTGPGVATALPGYNTTDFFQFNTGDSIATTPSSDDYRLFTVSYIANIQHSQPIGVYASTLTYTCLANF